MSGHVYTSAAAVASWLPEPTVPSCDSAGCESFSLRPEVGVADLVEQQVPTESNADESPEKGKKRGPQRELILG
jgi:hypothetical protein